jgi:monoamine oxidase
VQETDVIVLGGGFAGAVTARELAERGHSVTLIEARDRLGGRTWFKDDVIDGRPLEMGGQFLSTSHTRVYAEVERYGVPYTIRPPHGLADRWLVGGERHSGAIPLDPAELGAVEDLIVALRELAARIDPQRPLREQFDADELAALDVSADARMAELGVPERARELLSLVISPYAALESLDDVSWLHLGRMVADAGGVWNLVGGDSLVLDQGTRSLVEAIAADSGAEILFEHPVSSVVQDADGVTVEAGGETFRAPVVVCAMPLGVLPNVEFEPPLNPVRLEAAAARTGREGSKTWAVVRGVPESFFAEGRLPGLHQLASFEATDDGVLLYAFGPPKNWIDAAAEADTVLARLREFYPEVELVTTTAHNWRDDEFALGTHSHYAPGEIVRFEEVLQSPEGRVVFAGCETSPRFLGYIEGAVESGFRAADVAAVKLSGADRVAS